MGGVPKTEEGFVSVVPFELGLGPSGLIPRHQESVTLRDFLNKVSLNIEGGTQSNDGHVEMCAEIEAAAVAPSRVPWSRDKGTHDKAVL